MVIFTALLSASKARRSDIISAVAPPSFCLGIRLKIMKVRGNHKGMQINSCGKKETWTRLYLTKSVKIFKVCLVKSVPHYFNVHVIQVLEINQNHEDIHQRNKPVAYKHIKLQQ